MKSIDALRPDGSLVPTLEIVAAVLKTHTKQEVERFARELGFPENGSPLAQAASMECTFRYLYAHPEEGHSQ